MDHLVMDIPTVIKTVFVVSVGYLIVKTVRAAIKYMKWRRMFSGIPREDSFSILFGTLHKFPGPNEEGIAYDMKMIREKAPKMLLVWAGPFLPVILLHHPDVVRPLMKSSAPKPRGTFIAGPYDMGIAWLGEGLLIANGAKWARNRRLLTPAFHFDVLKPYMAVNNQATDVLLDKLSETSKKGESFDVFNFVSLCALDIILRCAFSYKTDCQISGDTNEYINAVNNLANLWAKRSLNPFLFVDFIYNLTPNGRKFKKHCDVVHKVAEEIIKKRKTVLEEEDKTNDENNGRKKVLDFLDILLKARDENGEGLTFMEIRNEVDTFLFEGHDTTTSGMSWMLYHMATHPEHQQKVQAEIDGVLKGRQSQHLLWDDLPKLEYLTICLKESLRKCPPVPFVERMLSEDTELDGHLIPKGTFIGIQINNLSNNPNIWDRPDKYNPQRFLQEDEDKMDTFSYVPFSAGPRNCIGQNFAMHEMKVVIARVLHRFDLKLDPSVEVKRQPIVTQRTELGMKIFATARKSN